MKVILEIQAVDRCDKKCWNADKFATRNKNHKFNKLVFMSVNVPPPRGRARLHLADF